MNFTINLSDFENICRTCLSKKENLSILKSTKIVEMIEACASIQISNNDLFPNQICIDCLEQLLKSYYFKQQCEKSNSILQKIVTENEETNTEIASFQDCLFAPIDQETIEKLKRECELKPVLIETEPRDVKSEDSPGLVGSWNSDDSGNSKDELMQNKTESQESFVNEALETDPHDSVDSWNSDDSEDSKDELVQNKTTKSQVLINNVKLMAGDKCNLELLRCNICEKSLPTLVSLARHMNTHSETRILVLKCKVCGKGFSDRGNLTKHLKRHKGDPQYGCEECGKKFYELHPLALHVRKKHNAQPIKCTTCNMTLYHPLQQERHNRIHAQKICNICGKICKTAKLLHRHKSSHSNNRPFSCDICDKCFKFNFEVTKHKKICHSGPQPREICSVCGKSILTRSLPSHLKSHDKGTEYKCEYCPKSYFCEETYKQHVKHKHTMKDCHYKLLCSICGRKVISPKDLKIHMLSHTQEKMYQCQQCDKKYKTPGALITHVRYTHENKRAYSCSTCMKAFHTKIILQNHMRTHTGERPFPCTVCDRAFGSKSILKTHMKTHKDF